LARLPPLNALRAFESAGRHLSFTKASDELAVTPTAISHQIRLLEDTLGVKLFRRLPRRLLLTDAGQELLAGARDAFTRLGTAVERVASGGLRGALTISSTVTFAWRWLVPRLQRFQSAHPEIDLRLDASQRAVDFHREGVDAAIRYGRGNWPGLYAVKLFEEKLSVLLSRELLASGPTPKSPRDILRYPLLRDSAVNDEDWRAWLTLAGVSPREARHGGVFDSSQMAIQAALGGAGAALVMPAFFVDELESGRLVQPFDLTIDSGKAQYFVCPEGYEARAKIAAFRDWIKAELAKEPLVNPPRRAAPAKAIRKRR
jgi:DNA-binding transcriptional LysR family regulator